MPRDVTANPMAAHPMNSPLPPSNTHALRTSHPPMDGRRGIATSGIASSMQADKQASAQSFPEFPPAVLMGTLTVTLPYALSSQEQKNLSLRQAASVGRVKDVIAWMDAGAILNAANEKGTTALMLAAMKDHADALKVLMDGLETSEAINFAGPDGTTALILAVKHVCPGAVQALACRLEPQDINHADHENMTALMYAASLGSPGLVCVLGNELKSAAAVNLARPDGMTALMLAARGKCSFTCRALMQYLQSEVEINKARPDGITALMLAVMEGSFDTVHAFVDVLSFQHGALNVFAPDGRTALSIANDHGHGLIVARLLDGLQTSGRAANTPGPVDESTLRIAGSRGHFGVLFSWLSAGVKEELIETFFEAFDAYHPNQHIHPQVLLQAAYLGSPRVVSILLARGVESDWRRDDGRSALDLAVKRGHFPVLEAWAAARRQIPHQLILNTPQAADFLGKHPTLDKVEAWNNLLLMRSAESGWTHLAQQLILNQNWKIHPNVLVAAAGYGNARMVSTLLRRGIDADWRRTDGLGALDFAIANGHFSVLDAWMASGRQVPYPLILKTMQAIGLHGDYPSLQAIQLSAGIVLRAASWYGWHRLSEALIAMELQADAYPVVTTPAADQHAHDQAMLEKAGRRGHFNVLFKMLASGASEEVANTFLVAFDAAKLDPLSFPNALRDAARFGYAGVFSMLLGRQLMVGDGSDALDLAISNGHLSVLNAWIASGRKVSFEQIFNAMQATGLYVAPEVFRRMNPLDAVDASGRTVLMLAESKGWAHLARALTAIAHEDLLAA
ncbi:ankyrin repeat domain-containing protein [Ottowia thiooxydans]|uniref:Ankyrin repeat protein n=1 Tax=Ottowia thiooxydans TaxID=219182 RepID=A0ABV2Q7I8_9BURK